MAKNYEAWIIIKKQRRTYARNELADTYDGEGPNVFEAGKEYSIMICQYSGYSDYTLNIE